MCLLGIKSIGGEVQRDACASFSGTPDRCFTKDFQAFPRFRPRLPGGGKYRMIVLPKGFQRFRAPPELMLILRFRQNVVLLMLFYAFGRFGPRLPGGEI